MNKPQHDIDGLYAILGQSYPNPSKQAYSVPLLIEWADIAWFLPDNASSR